MPSPAMHPSQTTVEKQIKDIHNFNGNGYEIIYNTSPANPFPSSIATITTANTCCNRK